ncbi:MAG: hypothetical protein IJM05_04120, partial [Bacteroidales bacterium]|nr:hypothetical protein [Bacteroidales bacterium]
MKTTIKHALLWVLAASALFYSCNKFESTEAQGPDEPRYNINVTLGGAAIEVETKTTGEASTVSANEAKV